jgi:hypothetical protein
LELDVGPGAQGLWFLNQRGLEPTNVGTEIEWMLKTKIYEHTENIFNVNLRLIQHTLPVEGHKNSDQCHYNMI